MMKKTYIAPEMETFHMQTVGPLLNTSNFNAEEWGGGGIGGSRIFEDDGMNFIMGGGEYSDLEKMLLP